MQVYFDGFANKEDVISNYNITEQDLNGFEILFAYYTYEDYSGESLVILKDADHQFYEVNGGHCSCYGLEGQWEVEPTTMDAMMKRNTPFFNEVVKTYISKHILNKELDTIIDTKSNKNTMKKI